MDKKVSELDFDISTSKEYKKAIIQNNMIYTNQTEYNLSDFYYSIACNITLEKKIFKNLY